VIRTYLVLVKKIIVLNKLSYTVARKFLFLIFLATGLVLDLDVTPLGPTVSSVS